LILGSAVMVGIITVAVLLSFTVPILRPPVHLVEDREKPPRTDVSKKKTNNKNKAAILFVAPSVKGARGRLK